MSGARLILSIGLTLGLGSLIAGCSTVDWARNWIRRSPTVHSVAQGISGAAGQPMVDPYAVTAVRQYHVQPGDELQVTLKGSTAVLGVATIDRDGRAKLPRKGSSYVGGLTLDQIAAMIEGEDGGGVAVMLQSPAPIYLLGPVGAPGAFDYQAGLTLGALLDRAGGASYKADLRNVYVKPRGSGGEVKVPYDGALPILPGDVVRLDERYF
jgi:protein involved in polysaccharide export with SLBB domain